MRQTILRLVCDDCGHIAQFEITNSDPLTAATDAGGIMERHGWTARSRIGFISRVYDYCPMCKKQKGDAPS